MCQGFSHFSAFLHHFVLAKLATSSIKVNKLRNNILFSIRPGKAITNKIRVRIHLKSIHEFIRELHFPTFCLEYFSKAAMLVSIYLLWELMLSLNKIE